MKFSIKSLQFFGFLFFLFEIPSWVSSLCWLFRGISENLHFLFDFLVVHSNQIFSVF